MAAGPVPETPYDRSMTGSGGSAPLVELDGLTVRLGGRTVLDAVTARLDGRAVGLLGPNGAGKTTLIRTLLGFHRPAAGKAAVLGLPVGSGAALARRIGYMPEHEAFIAGMTGVRLVRMLAELSGLDRREALERAHEALVWTGLGEARYRTVETYSAGMRQLLKLAQAVVHRPQLLILDEPLDGLDPVGREWMMHLMRERADAGGTVVVSTHVLHEVEAIADRVVFVADGRVVASGALGEVRETIRSEPARYRVVCGAPRELAATLVVREGTVSVGVEPGEGAVLVRTFDQDGLLAAVTRLAATGRFGITGVAPVDRDAESVYAYVMAERGRSR